MEFSWRVSTERIMRRHIGSFGRLAKEPDLRTKAPDYSPEDLKASQLLVAPDVRRFLLELAQYGKARSVDAGLNTASTEALLQLRILRREYLVLCKKDSRTICKIADRAELENAVGGNFTCTVCERPFKEETVQEIFAPTDFGRQLLAGSRWMTIWLTDLLVQAGICREQIAWNATAGPDELDIMTDALGPRIFFELKDREFGLGDAYPFSIRLGRYGGRYGVVVTTDRVAEDAKKIFAEQAAPATRVDILEGHEKD